MDHRHFLQSFEWINRDLKLLKVNRAYKSLGWNVFFEFGKNIEIPTANGKSRSRKEWKIWIGNASWRITKGEEYYAGSQTPASLQKSGDFFVDSPTHENTIQQAIQIFLEKQFHSLNVISPFLDAEFVFENDLKITTFFNSFDDRQWLAYLPDRTEIFVDCSTKESVADVVNFSKQLAIKDKYTKTRLLQIDPDLEDIHCNEDDLSFGFANHYQLDTRKSAWRITKNNEYLIGRLDHYFKKEGYNDIISQLHQKKLTGVATDQSGMDARFQFGEGYVLEVFRTALHNQWTFSQNGKMLFSP